jgi:hypothetical protein
MGENRDRISGRMVILGIDKTPVLRGPAAAGPIDNPVADVDDVGAERVECKDNSPIELPQHEAADRIALRKLQPRQAFEFRE